MIKSRLRLVLTLVIFAISIAALAWSFLPGARIVRRQIIQPTEMQLPTPSGFLPASTTMAGWELTIQRIRNIDDAELFVLFS